MKDIAITIDVDWAPDFMIRAMAKTLIESQVRATWFVTHESIAIEQLRQHSDLFELAIHPNFLPGSTHGSTPIEVLRHCMKIVPDSISMRTHALVQSGPLLLSVLKETPILADVSLFFPRMPDIVPIRYEVREKLLIRIPFFWEDCFELEGTKPSWHLADDLLGRGLKVFSFHPIHVYLNTTDLSLYSGIKRLGPLQALSQKDMDPFAQSGDGPRTMFQEITDLLRRNGNSLRICDVLQLYQDAH